jgi:hypothetical protein
VGIELTAIHPNGAERRWQESEQAALLALASELHRNSGREPIHIWIHWRRTPLILKSNRYALARRLCHLVADHCSPESKYTELAEAALMKYLDLPVAHLGYAAASSWESAEWREGGFHKVAPLGASEVQAFLDSEEHKTRRYREPYAAVWVVLLCETAGPSTWGVAASGLWEAEFQSSFRRAFLIELGHRTCGELKIV